MMKKNKSEKNPLTLTDLEKDVHDIAHTQFVKYWNANNQFIRETVDDSPISRDIFALYSMMLREMSRLRDEFLSKAERSRSETVAMHVSMMLREMSRLRNEFLSKAERSRSETVAVHVSTFGDAAKYWIKKGDFALLLSTLSIGDKIQWDAAQLAILLDCELYVNNERIERESVDEPDLTHLSRVQQMDEL